MNKEELLQFLKENLKIHIEYTDLCVKARLSIGDDGICECTSYKNENEVYG